MEKLFFFIIFNIVLFTANPVWTKNTDPRIIYLAAAETVMLNINHEKAWTEKHGEKVIFRTVYAIKADYNPFNAIAEIGLTLFSQFEKLKNMLLILKTDDNHVTRQLTHYILSPVGSMSVVYHTIAESNNDFIEIKPCDSFKTSNKTKAIRFTAAVCPYNTLDYIHLSGTENRHMDPDNLIHMEKDRFGNATTFFQVICHWDEKGKGKIVKSKNKLDVQSTVMVIAYALQSPAVPSFDLLLFQTPAIESWVAIFANFQCEKENRTVLLTAMPVPEGDGFLEFTDSVVMIDDNNDGLFSKNEQFAVNIDPIDLPII